MGRRFPASPVLVLANPGTGGAGAVAVDHVGGTQSRTRAQSLRLDRRRSPDRGGRRRVDRRPPACSVSRRSGEQGPRLRRRALGDVAPPQLFFRMDGLVRLRHHRNRSFRWLSLGLAGSRRAIADVLAPRPRLRHSAARSAHASLAWTGIRDYQHRVNAFWPGPQHAADAHDNGDIR